jgi:hypothetical protein
MHGDHRVNRPKLHELQVLLAVAPADSGMDYKVKSELGDVPK